MKHPGYTEEQERALGQAVVNLLDLKFTKEYPDRVNTVYGTKTVLGYLCSKEGIRCVKRAKECKRRAI